MHTVLLVIAICATSAEAPDTVVVCPMPLRTSLQPWVEYRHAQGHRLAFVDGAASPREIRAAIGRHARGGKLRFVLLVGDVAQEDAEPSVKATSVPTHWAKAKVNVRWGSEPEIATDNPYADLDGDGVPELAVGRLTADTPAELASMVRKIIAYERAAAGGAWRRKVNVVAGIGGFGPLVDSVVEMAAKKFITEGIPSAYATTMTYGSWHSPYCPDPRHFQRATLQRLNEGCLFWVYIGHGQRTFLDRIRVPGGVHPIFNVNDTAALRCTQGSPIAVMLACYTGAFDQERDCLAEEMLASAGGPVAVLCGSRVTMPYAMAVMGNDLLDEVFKHRCKTLGETVRNAKRRMIAPADADGNENNKNRILLDKLAAVIGSSPEMLQQERAEHLLLFNLLGDPLLRLPHPREVKLTSATTVEAGQTLEVSGDCATAGRCTIELVCRRDRITFAPPVRERFVSTAAFGASLDDVYIRANDHRWSSHTFDVEGGPFRVRLPISQRAHGPCHVRVYVEGQREFALGATDVFVRRHRPKQIDAQKQK